MTAAEALERARQSLAIAEKLIETDLATSANRVYNAGENLGIAALLSVSGQTPKSHGKVWNSVNLLYQRGTLKADYKRILEQSYRLRIKGDYGQDLEGKDVNISEGVIKELITSLKSFLEEVEGLVKGRQMLHDR